MEVLRPARVPFVIGPQYCLPYAVDLTVQRKIRSFGGDDFVISDANGRVVLRMDGQAPSLRKKTVLFDGSGNPLLCLKRKVTRNVV